jgi:hypothetical protein
LSAEENAAVLAATALRPALMPVAASSELAVTPKPTLIPPTERRRRPSLKSATLLIVTQEAGTWSTADMAKVNAFCASATKVAAEKPPRDAVAFTVYTGDGMPPNGGGEEIGLGEGGGS